ncbi:MAG TPA: DinB family protein [Anaerolineae bacterium]|nr:DinB family protein [Anaerolineae bacterium]
MTPQERRQRIESYGRAYQLLIDDLKNYPREMWQYRPAPDRWTIHEIVVHIADSEANSYVRCRRFIAEPGSSVIGYDEMKWAKELHYHNQSVEDALELFNWLRRKSFTLITDLPEATWANTVMHTESGKMTMDDWLVTYERHIPEHLAQMAEVYKDWLAR